MFATRDEGKVPVIAAVGVVWTTAVFTTFPRSDGSWAIKFVVVAPRTSLSVSVVFETADNSCLLSSCLLSETAGFFSSSSTTSFFDFYDLTSAVFLVVSDELSDNKK